jgi:hypothetical protein
MHLLLWAALRRDREQVVWHVVQLQLLHHANTGGFLMYSAVAADFLQKLELLPSTMEIGERNILNQ